MIKTITWKGLREGAFFHAIGVIVFLYGLQLVGKYNGVVTWYWVLTMFVVAPIMASGVYYLSIKNMSIINWLAVVLLRLIIWPVLMWKTNKTSKVSVIMLTMVPFVFVISTWIYYEPALNQGFDKYLVIGFYSVIYFVLHFVWGMLLELIFPDIHKESFLNIPKISDFKKEITND